MEVGMADAISTLDRLRAFQMLNREWREHLTITERDFLAYLMDNTISWGRDCVEATVEQMLAGTDWGLPSVGMARRTVFKVIQSLSAKGVIIVEKTRRKINRYVVNLRWSLDMKIPSKPKAKPEGAVRTPKNPRKTVSASRALAPESECTKRTPSNSSTPSEREVSTAPRADRSGGWAETIAEVLTKTSRKKLYTSDKLPDVWKRAWIEGSYGAPPPGLDRRSIGQLKHILRRFPNGLDIIEWAVANWKGACSRQFAWMTKSPPPAYPAPGFLLKHVLAFAEDYLTETSEERTATMPSDQKEYRRLRDDGMSHDEALLEMGKARARGESREQDSKAKERADREWQALKLERAKIERLRRTAPTTTTPQGPKETPKLDHGDNPWETGGGDVADFSDLGEWDG